jgi:hypothetical protein
MPHGKLKELYYNPNTLPPRISWPIPVQIARGKISQLCEQLHAIVSERQGAAFYYPNVDLRKTTCRYEWHATWRRQKFALRLGVMVEIGDQDIEQFDAYITTNTAFEDPATALPPLSSKLIERLQNEVFETLEAAARRSKPEAHRDRHMIFHIEMPYMMGVGQGVTSHDNRIHLFPTVIIKKENKRVSAVSVTVNAASNESGKAEGLRHLGLLCALLTLANGQFYQSINLKWSRNRPAIRFLDSLENVDTERLYPYRKRPPQPEPFNENVAERFGWIWRQFHELDSSDTGVFLPALFAYYAGRDVFGKQSTLAIVAFMAALSSLAKNRVQRCPGEIICSDCGELTNFHHYIAGDRAAITSLIIEILQLNGKPSEKQEVNALIARAYRKQRSAFVHGAEFRHEEYHQGVGLPSAFPTSEEPVRDIYLYQSDLLSLEAVTRRTLLGWIAQKTNVSLDHKLLGLEGMKIRLRSSIDSVVTLPANRVVVLQMRDKENAS